MRILMYIENVNFRGTTVAALDYAQFLQLAGHELIIGFNSKASNHPDITTNPQALKDTCARYMVADFASEEMEKYCARMRVDLVYFINAGRLGPIVRGVKNVVHAVFRFREPYGDVYAYISKWLSDYMSNGNLPYVPFMINLPTPTENLRNLLQISREQTLIGRYGGLTTFELDYVKSAILKIVNQRADITFLFMNTAPFAAHERILFVKGSSDRQLISNLIETCDGFIHARAGGESFGLAIAEPLSFGKPVLSSYAGNDKNHLEMLAGTGLLYDESNVIEKICDIKSYSQDYESLVQSFRPSQVMRKFNKVFLS